MADATSHSWLHDATCRHHIDNGGDDIWFAPGRALEAIQLCMTCPVLPDCATHAIRTEEPGYGVIGGMTPRRRNHERAATQRAKQAA